MCLVTYLQICPGLLEEEEDVWPVLSHSGMASRPARAHTGFANLPSQPFVGDGGGDGG